MIRKLKPADREVYLRLADEFYHTAGVLHPVPQAHFERTFEEMMRSDTYVECWLCVQEQTGEAMGYCQVSKTFSQEAGGLVIWLEECYIPPQYQRQGLGRQLLEQVERAHPEAKRFRAEVEADNVASKAMFAARGYACLAYEQLVLERP